MLRSNACALLLLQLLICHGFVVKDDVNVFRYKNDADLRNDLSQLLLPFIASSATSTTPRIPTRLYDSNDNDSEKFGLYQRFESVKCLVIGGIAGSTGFAPVGLVKDLLLQHASVAQWEFDTDMAALQAGLFAIVYRYCIRQDASTNPQLGQGVIGAFCLTRTLAAIHIPDYCSAVPLQCGAPLGYVDWNILGQGLVNGAASAAIFVTTAAAIDKAMNKGFLSRFPG